MNNYQKMNEQIRLSEEQKEEMVSVVLHAETGKAKKRRALPVRWMPAAVAFAAILLAVIIHTPSGSLSTSLVHRNSESRSADTASVEENEEVALTSEYALKDAMAEATEYESLEALEKALGYTVELPEEIPFEVAETYYYAVDGEAEIDYYSKDGEVYIYVYSPEE